jgi:broad specificity phosphatase PhoE
MDANTAKHTRAKTIITIRHGQQDRSGETYDDSVGGPLSALGRDQVRTSRGLLKPILHEMGGLTITACITSDWERATETAKIFTEGSIAPEEVIEHPGLRERNLGDLDHSQQHTDPAFNRFKKDALCAVPPGGESLEMLLQGRLREPIDIAHHLGASTGGVVVISAHGGVNHALIREFTGMSNRQLTNGPLVEGSDLVPLQKPGRIKNGQMHIYTLSNPDAPFYDVRTVGIVDDHVFDGGIVSVDRG